MYEDNPDNIIGILNMKDLIFHDPDEPFDLKKMLRKPYFTIENKGINELLEEMQKDQYNMTIVLDEYGELAGILTVEDIIEEIVGEVQDEFDASENENIIQVGLAATKCAAIFPCTILTMRCRCIWTVKTTIRSAACSLKSSAVSRRLVNSSSLMTDSVSA